MTTEYVRQDLRQWFQATRENYRDHLRVAYPELAAKLVDSLDALCYLAEDAYGDAYDIWSLRPRTIEPLGGEADLSQVLTGLTGKLNAMLEEAVTSLLQTSPELCAIYLAIRLAVLLPEHPAALDDERVELELLVMAAGPRPAQAAAQT